MTSRITIATGAGSGDIPTQLRSHGDILATIAIMQVPVVSIVPGTPPKSSRHRLLIDAHKRNQLWIRLRAIDRSFYVARLPTAPGQGRNQAGEREFKLSRSTRGSDIRSLTGMGSKQSPDARRPQAISGRHVPGVISTVAQPSSPSIVSSAREAWPPTVAIDRGGPAEARAASWTVAANARRPTGSQNIGLGSSPLCSISARWKIARALTRASTEMILE